MSCCGRQRGTLGPVSASSSASDHAMTRLRYLGDHDIQVRGPATGLLYVFRVQAPEQRVTRQDAEAMLASRLFRRL